MRRGYQSIVVFTGIPALLLLPAPSTQAEGEWMGVRIYFDKK